MTEKENNKNWWRPAVMVFSEISTWIATPIVLALIAGKALDKHYGSEPWIFLGLTFIAFLFSLFYIWKNVKSYMSDLEKPARPHDNSGAGGEEKDLPASGGEKK